MSKHNQSTRRNSLQISQQIPKKTRNPKYNYDLNPSATDYKKIIKQLESMVQQEKYKREEMEKNMEAYRSRIILREKQFHRVLQLHHHDLHKYRNDSKQKGSGVDHISGMFSTLSCKMEESGEATNYFLEKQFSDTLAMMERRVFRITQTFKQQCSKNKKISQESSKQIRSDLEQIITLTQTIQNQNIELKRKLEQQLFKNRVLTEQKQLLIGEVVQKKKIITKIYSQRKSACSFKKSNNYIRDNESQYIPKFICEPSLDLLSTVQKNNSTIGGNFKPEKRESTRTNRSLIMKKNQSQQLPSSKAIQYLQMSLNREKKRNTQLGKLFTKIQNRNREINKVITQLISNAKEQGAIDKSAIQKLLQCEQLFEVINNFKQKEQIDPGSNWGPTDTSQLLNILENE